MVVDANLNMLNAHSETLEMKGSDSDAHVLNNMFCNKRLILSFGSFASLIGGKGGKTSL